MQKGSYGIQVLVGGVPLPEYEHNGKTYVAAPLGREFELRVITPYYERTEVVMSVDGLDVLTGEDAEPGNRGYVISRETYDCPGFRLDDDHVAHFEFLRPGRSYAALKGKRSNVGVIGAVFFSEERAPRFTMASRGASRGGLESADAGFDAGTGFGREVKDSVGHTHFTRDREVARLALYYKTEEQLRKEGIISNAPNPFPAESKRKGGGARPPKGWKGRGQGKEY